MASRNLDTYFIFNSIAHVFMLSFPHMKSIILCLALLLIAACSTPKKRELHMFHFPPGKGLPSLSDTNRFKCIMEKVKANTNATLIVNGNMHPANQKLTDDRVWVVVNALDSADIDLGRIHIKEPSPNRSHIPNNQWFTIVIVF